MNNKYLRNKINIRTCHLKSSPPYIIPAIIIILSTVFSDDSIKPSGPSSTRFEQLMSNTSETPVTVQHGIWGSLFALKR